MPGVLYLFCTTTCKRCEMGKINGEIGNYHGRMGEAEIGVSTAIPSGLS